VLASARGLYVVDNGINKVMTVFMNYLEWWIVGV
jgi:hypothetical protein